jgi:hypothetical protein
MSIVNVGSILTGLFLWFIPSWKFRSRSYVFSAAPRKNTLHSQRKQIVAGLYITMGVLGIIAGLHETVVVIAGIIFAFIAAFMADYPLKKLKPATRPSPNPYLQELGRKSDEIYAFLSKPENAALKTRVMNNVMDRMTGEILIQQMGGKSYQYGLPFFEAMQYAVDRPSPESRPRFCGQRTLYACERRNARSGGTGAGCAARHWHDGRTGRRV